MEGVYDIFRGTEKIGKADVRRQGLYYRFRCCCNLTGEVIYRLTASDGTKTVNLGIPVPDGDSFCLETRIPISRFANGTLSIQAQPRTPQQKRIFAPVYPDEPFGYISRLETARMERRDNKIGISFDC